MSQISIDKLLQTEIEKQSSDKEVAVLLSGGVDSLSVAFAAQRLGKTINAYTFHLKGQPSYDSIKAQQISIKNNWYCRVIEVPTDNLEEDFIYLAKEIKCVKKTHFECCYPFIHLYPQIKEREVLSGWAADGYYGISKKAILHYGPGKPKSKFDEFRNTYFDKQNQAGYIWHNRVAEMNNKKFITPYLTENVKQYFYNMSWLKLNKPTQKHHVRKAFKKEFMNTGVKKHINLQLGSGVDKLFETLLNNKKINTNNRKRVMDICRDWSIKVNKINLEDF